MAVNQHIWPWLSQPQEAVESDWSNPINDRLSLRLLFNEGGGSLRNIGNGPAQSYAPVGNPAWSVDESGVILPFDGSTQYVSISTTSAQRVSRASDITTGSGITLAAWVKFTYTNSGNYRSILGAVQDAPNTNWACGGLDWLDGAVATQPRMAVYDGEYKIVNGTIVSLADAQNKWHHIAGVLDSAAGLMRLYVNGRADGTVAFSKAGASLEPTRFNVGRFPGTNATHLDANGPIQDARVYRRALYADEIWRVYSERYADLSTQSIWVPVSAGGGGGTVTLDAAATAQATATATLLKGVTLAGAALAVSTASADLQKTVPLAASAQATATASGQIELTVTLAAGAVAQALATAGLSVGKPLAASAQAQAAATADLNVVAGGGAVNLAADAAAQASASATLSLAVNLSAAAVAQAHATAELSGSAALAAAVIAQAQASASLAVGKPLAAAAQAQASAGATLWVSIPLSVDALAAASADADLSLTVTLASAAVARASASATLPGVVMLSAAGVALASATAELQVTGPLAGAATLVARDTRRNWRVEPERRSWEARRPITIGAPGS